MIVDAANVVGSRPDGWWRDPAAATVRLRDELVAVARAGLPSLPAPIEVVLVVEGAARHVAPVPGVRVVPAPGAGDETVVDLVRARPPGRVCVVITADRALRARVERAGALVRGPRSLWPIRTVQEGRSSAEPDRF